LYQNEYTKYQLERVGNGGKIFKDVTKKVLREKKLNQILN